MLAVSHITKPKLKKYVLAMVSLNVGLASVMKIGREKTANVVQIRTKWIDAWKME